MAIKYWIGNYPDAEYDYSNQYNWTPNGVPASNDDVVIGLTNAPIKEGLAQSAVALDTFVVLPTYTGDIGTPDDWLVIDVDETVNYSGSGDAYLDLSAVGGCDRLVVEQPAATTGSLYIKHGSYDFTEAYVSRGVVYHSGGIGELRVTHVTSLAGDATFIHSSGTISSAYIHGGTYEQHGGSVATGTMIVLDGMAIIYAGTIDEAKLWGGGTLDYRTTDNPTSLTVYGDGTLTFANDTRAKTVTTLYAYGSPSIVLANGVANITITNTYTLGVPTITTDNDLRTVTLA